MMPGKSGIDDNPYIDELISHFSKHVLVSSFNWRVAFFSNYDVFHLHWPEQVIRDDRRLARILKSGAMLALVALNQLRRRPHIWTMHNTSPHESGPWLERLALRAWIASCSKVIAMNCADAKRDKRCIEIPHGHFKDFARQHLPSPTPSRSSVLFVPGFIRPYKNLERLIEVSNSLAPFQVRIAGEARDKSYGEHLIDLADQSSAVVQLGRMTADALVSAAAGAYAIVLPYKSIGNSGVALLALSIGRPIVVTDSPAMRELQNEIGERWVQIVGPDWQASDVLDALATFDEDPRQAPDLALRDWHRVSGMTEDLYRVAVSGVTD